ncbi:MAG TPA: GntG family PLP-dependent aldolase, partial [Chitinophagales bacterium]
TKAMLDAMFSASVGDDVFGEDPSVNALEAYAAQLFGMEAALFCPSGTMTNQIAIKAQTQPLDEIICDKISHIYNYETAGFAFHSGVSIRLTDGERGVMNVAQVEACVLPEHDWYPTTKMVCIENSVNKGGGAIYTIEQMQKISDFCRKNNLVFHLDGARIFNALTALNKTPKDLHGMFDSISVCISKGLGAPAGSVLLGKKEMIKRARRIRKVFGGGMRQSGYLASACLFALQNNVTRLAEDHEHATVLAETLSQLSWVKNVFPVQTNIVIFEVENSATTAQILAEKGIKTSPFSPTLVRMVTHLDFTKEQLQQAVEILKTL